MKAIKGRVCTVPTPVSTEMPREGINPHRTLTELIYLAHSSGAFSEQPQHDGFLRGLDTRDPFALTLHP